MYVNQFRYNITGSELESIITYSNLEFIDAIKTNILQYFKVVRVFFKSTSVDIILVISKLAKGLKYTRKYVLLF